MKTTDLAGPGRAKVVAAAVLVAAGLAKPAEGLYLRAYRDPPGVLSACYGSTRNIDPAKVYTIAECEQRLEADMLEAVRTVERCVPGLPVHTLAAWGDAVYNLGPTIACDQKNSTAARMLAANQWRAACDQLPRWNKARVAGFMVPLPGLTKRRGIERDFCIQGLAAAN